MPSNSVGSRRHTQDLVAQNKPFPPPTKLTLTRPSRSSKGCEQTEENFNLRLDLVRGCIEQHIEADVEQVAPAPDQMIEQSLLVFEQSVVTAIQLVDFGQPEVFAEQIGHGTALKPFAMQPPLAARRQQPVGRQQQQHPVPPRTLAARRQPSAPETIELQLAPPTPRQTANAPPARAGH